MYTKCPCYSFFRACRSFHTSLLQLRTRNPNTHPSVPLKSMRNLPGRFRDRGPHEVFKSSEPPETPLSAASSFSPSAVDKEPPSFLNPDKAEKIEREENNDDDNSDSDVFHDNGAQSATTKCVLVGIRLPHMSEQEVESSLKELAQLVSTLGFLKPCYFVTQRRDSLRGHVLGSGKINEIARLTGGPGLVTPDEDPSESGELAAAIQAEGAEGGEGVGAVIVDVALTATQIRVLEDALGVEVHDRPSIIMSIFQRHARTREAKIQVEIARLTYMAPRLRELNSTEDRVRGGVGGRGVGETSIELEGRKVRDKIAALRRELSTVQKITDKQRKLREGSVVALVGYTNAGKSSLFRALTGVDVLVADQLFATLDTTVRAMPRTTPRLLVSDTVGFINNLPHELIASFRSTLSEARNAGMLLLVVDASDSQWRVQLGVVRDVLADMKANRPTLLVMNKVDRLSSEERQALSEEVPDAVQVSSLNAGDVTRLREQVVSFFEKDAVEWECFIEYTDQQVLQAIYDSCRVLSAKHDEKGTRLRLKVHSNILEQLRTDERLKSVDVTSA